MKSFITNLLIAVVLLGAIGYVGYNVKKVNPDFTLVPDNLNFNIVTEIITDKQNEAKRKELEQTINFEETSIEETNLEKINRDEKINKEDIENNIEVINDIERGQKNVRNNIKYLKYLDLYSSELFENIVSSYKTDINVYRKYNELYNSDLISNDITGEIEVELIPSSENYLGIWKFTAKVPLSNNTVKVMNGEMMLGENHEWRYYIDDDYFKNALANTYPEDTLVSIEKQEKVLELFKNDFYAIMETVKEKEGYMSLEKYFNYDRTGFVESDKTYEETYNGISEIVNDADYKLESISSTKNQIINKKDLLTKSGKKAYTYDVLVNYTIKYKEIPYTFSHFVVVDEVEGEIYINDCVESSFVPDFIKYYHEEY